MKKLVRIALVAALAIFLTLCFVSCDKMESMIKFMIYASEAADNCEKRGHEWHTYDSYSATCTEEGLKVRFCENCGLEEVEAIPALGHIEKVVPGTAATCTRDGVADAISCERCGMTVQYPDTIYATGHTESIIEGVAPTCTENGLTEGAVCSVCDEVLYEQQVIPSGHDIVKLEYVAPTCTVDGLTEGEGCSRCDYVVLEQTVIPAGHNYQQVSGYPADCYSTGCTDGEICKGCGDAKVAQEIIPITHGNTVPIQGYPATCTEDGLTDGEACDICGTTLKTREIIPAGHTEEIVPGVAATCRSTGLTDGKVCSECGVLLEEQKPIDKIAHSFVSVKGFAATCSSNGLSDGVACKFCGTPSENQYTLYATGHTFGDDGKCTGCALTATTELVYEPVYETSVLSFISFLSGENQPVAYKVKGLIDGANVTEVVIPDKHQGLSVIGIMANAFEGNSQITKVILTKSIVEVGENAFNNCASLATVECEDFTQINSWASNWYGTSNKVQIAAPFNNGKTPYELYLEAMHSVNHGINRYKMNTEQYSYNIVYGQTSLDTYTNIKQYQYYDDCYVYQYVKDYTSGQESFGEMYYVGEYLYQPGQVQIGYTTYSGVKIPYSLECWMGEMMIDRSDVPEFTEEYFQSVEFIKKTDGSMYLKVEMNGDLLMKVITDILGNQFEDMGEDVFAAMQLEAVYEYYFDADGDLWKYTSDATIMNAGVYGVKNSSVSTISAVGTYSGVSVPDAYNYYDASSEYASYCPDGKHWKETFVEGYDPTCYANGMKDFAYCSRCYESIIDIEIIPATHSYENGVCTDCGEYADENISDGLAFVLTEDGNGYIIVGIGSCRDEVIHIPTHIYGLPVVKINADAFDGTDVVMIYIDGQEISIGDFEGYELNQN